MNRIWFVLAIFSLLVPSAISQTSTFEENIDRSAQDYRSYPMSEPIPQACQETCLDEERCQAWTYVRPGVQGQNAMCWLKDGVPGANYNSNTISGVVSRTASDTPSPRSRLTTIEAEPWGVWDTSEGTWQPGLTGNELFGSYSSDGGRIFGALSGMVLNGYWAENSSNVRCSSERDGTFYWGRVRFNFNQDFSQFVGAWSYCADTPTGENWIGTRRPELNMPALADGSELEECPKHRWDTQIGDTYSCYCKPHGLENWTEYDFVVGSGPYSPASAICLAAIHSEAISKEGGTINVLTVDEAFPYLGRTGGGPFFSVHSSVRRGFSLRVEGGDETPGAWRPKNASAFNKEDIGLSFRMFCPKEWTSNSGVSVLGSGPYNTSSNICPSAVHAGVIDKDGGFLTFVLQAPRDLNLGSEQNGVTSRDVPPQLANRKTFSFIGAQGGAPSFDLSGTWKFGDGEETWTFKKTADDTYEAQENGFSNAFGTAVVDGNTVRIDFQCGTISCTGSFTGTFSDRSLIKATRSDGTDWTFIKH